MIVTGLGRARLTLRQRFEYVMKRLYRCINWLPIFATALPIALFALGAGAWGKERHPIIHGWVSSGFFRDVCYPWVTQFLPIAFYAIYIALFFQKRIARAEVLSSMVLYSLIIGGFWCFAILILGLANQGAGR
jgi:hypothetical protein